MFISRSIYLDSCAVHGVEAFKRQVVMSARAEMTQRFHHLLNASKKHGYGNDRVRELIKELKTFVVANSALNEKDSTLNFSQWYELFEFTYLS
jgi:hypothetical protein